MGLGLPAVGVQPISPSAVVSRIFEIYRDQWRVLLGVAVLVYALEFVINLVLSSAAGIALVLLFWALSILYHSVGQLLRSVEPAFWPLVRSRFCSESPLGSGSSW